MLSKKILKQIKADVYESFKEHSSAILMCKFEDAKEDANYIELSEAFNVRSNFENEAEDVYYAYAYAAGKTLAQAFDKLFDETVLVEPVCYMKELEVELTPGTFSFKMQVALERNTEENAVVTGDETT